MEPTIFSYIDSILFNKQKPPQINESETQFNMFMVNRWITMHSTHNATIINETANRYSSTLITKNDQFEFLYNVIPKTNHGQKINYIKKIKEQKIEKETKNSIIAKYKELSVREIDMYVDLLEELNK